MKITFLERPGCHLCDEALEQLRGHLAASPGQEARFEIDRVNIETDDRLHRLYLERIPVILIGERMVSELFFDPEEFDAAVESHPRGSR